MMPARLVIASVICMGIAWLYWHTGPILVNMQETGWSIIRAGWPFTLAGLLLGIAVGYTFGEMARRKLAVEQLSRDVERTTKEIREDAHEVGLLAQNTLERALSLCEENWDMKNRLEREGKEIHSMKMEAETEMEAVEGFQKKYHSARGTGQGKSKNPTTEETACFETTSQGIIKLLQRTVTLCLYDTRTRPAEPTYIT